MDYEYEYGRYKKKVADQQKEIAELHGYIDGLKQVLKANDAIITAMLLVIGATEDNHLEVPQETINMVLGGRYRVMSRLDEESRVHKVFVEEAGE